MREFAQIAVSKLTEPDTRMRVEMDDEKFLELVADIQRQGVLQSLLVRPAGDSFQVIAGHRRLLASRQAGIESVPCLVVTGEDDNHIGMMIAENLFREDVTPVEEGELFKLVAALPGISEAEIQRRIGKPLGYIYSRIALVDGDPDIAMAVHKRQLTLGVAQELNKIKADNFRRMYLEQAVQTGCTIERAKQMVSSWRLVNAGLSENQLQPLEPLPGPEHVAVGHCCRLCNSPRDQHTLEPVWIHREELHAILSAQRILEAQRAGVLAPE